MRYFSFVQCTIHILLDETLEMLVCDRWVSWYLSVNEDIHKENIRCITIQCTVPYDRCVFMVLKSWWMYSQGKTLNNVLFLRAMINTNTSSSQRSSKDAKMRRCVEATGGPKCVSANVGLGRGQNWGHH